jgi:hypothetical protein
MYSQWLMVLGLGVFGQELGLNSNADFDTDFEDF